MTIIDTSALLHAPMVEYWGEESRRYEEECKHNMLNRFDRAEGLGMAQRANGDDLLEQCTNLFLYGMGVDWSAVQIRIFQALIDSILPRFYGTEWEEVKARVMAQRGIERMQPWTLVNMARRNGKTWVVSGAAAAIFLTIPDISLAVFSVGRRQAAMFMSSAIEKIELAFNRGTHVNRNGYNLIQKNQEVMIYEHPSGTKQILGCYPGSVKVSVFFPFSKKKKKSPARIWVKANTGHGISVQFAKIHGN